jgi:2-polyprenyl-6-methoxyphenol hydroxylase-like FAD-dependent oxidoreductase
VLDKPDLQKPDTGVFYILATWAKQDSDYFEGKNAVDELRRGMDDWADPFASAVDWIPKDTQAKAVQLGIWGLPETGLDNRDRRVTLAGDAAHSMTFHRGQGANNAIYDTEKFVSVIIRVKNGEKSLLDAVNEYDADVISRGRTEVEASRIQTDAFHDHAKFLESPVVKHGIKPLSEVKK